MKLSFKYAAGHVPELDGVRGLAVLMILIYHFGGFFPLSLVANAGWVGVDLFFVLSGFLITGILLDTKHQQNFFKNFFARRALRILPLYYMVLCVSFIVLGVIFKHKDFTPYLSSQIYFWAYIPNILFAFHGWVEGSQILNHLWSLAIEEQFYLFWPFIIWIIPINRILRVSILGILLSLLLRNLFPDMPFAYVFTFCRIDGLLVGASLAVLIRTNKEFIERYALSFLGASGVAVFLTVLLSHNFHFSNIHFIRYGYTLFDVFFGCVLIFIFNQNTGGKMIATFFRSKSLIWLGKYSYGIYVYQTILHNLYFEDILVFTNMYIASTEVSQIASSIILITSILLLSYGSYHLYEKHFIKMKRYFH